MAATSSPAVVDDASVPGRRRLSARRLPHPEILLPLAAFALLLLVWWIAYRRTVFLPSPVEVVRSFPKYLRQGGVLGNVLATLRRVLVGLLIATLLAVVTAVAMASSKRLNRLLQTYVFVAFSIPSLAAAIFGLMIFGLSDLGIYFAVAVITFPFITVGIRDGVASVDKTLVDMANVYRFGTWRKVRYITIPNLEPYLLVALRNAHALAWKVAIIAEVFSARNGIGGQYSRAFDNFRLDEVIFWLVVFLISVFIMEYGVLRQIERRLFRWRYDTALAR